MTEDTLQVSVSAADGLHVYRWEPGHGASVAWEILSDADRGVLTPEQATAVLNAARAVVAAWWERAK